MASSAAKALKAEATKPEFIEIEFRGETYTIPGNIEDYDIEVIEAFEDEKIVPALRALLGAEQWKAMKVRHGLKFGDLEELAKVVFGEMGLSVGKSEG